MKASIFTFDGEQIYSLTQVEVSPMDLQIEHPAGFFFILSSAPNCLYGFNHWVITPLGESGLFIASHPGGNVLFRRLGELAFKKATDVEALAYNTGVEEAARRLSYLKVMKDLFLTNGLKGLLAFLTEKVQRASISGWTPSFGETENE